MCAIFCKWNANEKHENAKYYTKYKENTQKETNFFPLCIIFIYWSWIGLNKITDEVALMHQTKKKIKEKCSTNERFEYKMLC